MRTWVGLDARHETALMINENPKTVGAFALNVSHRPHQSFYDR
jgi:hypothetical protein